jgi:hypothetical protein
MPDLLICRKEHAQRVLDEVGILATAGGPPNYQG